MRMGIVLALFMIADAVVHADFVDSTHLAFMTFDAWTGALTAICMLFIATVQDLREIVKQKGHF